MTRLHRLTIPCPSEHRAGEVVDALEAAFAPHPVAAGHLETSDGAWSAEAYYEEPPAAAAIVALLNTALGATANGLAVTIEEMPERDWVAESQRGLSPVRAGRFYVHGSHDRGTAPAGVLAIEIEAGLAFGTGHHATTAGCLEALDKVLRARRFASPLDLGCGSAVLAIAAAKALATPVLATDIDPVAVAVARANAALNGVAPLVRPLVADALSHPAFAARGPFDLVLANILAAPLEAMATPLARHLAPGGIAILSGLLISQARSVAARYRAAGLHIQGRIYKNEWATLTLVAPGALRQK